MKVRIKFASFRHTQDLHGAYNRSIVCLLTILGFYPTVVAILYMFYHLSSTSLAKNHPVHNKNSTKKTANPATMTKFARTKPIAEDEHVSCH